MPTLLRRLAVPALALVLLTGCSDGTPDTAEPSPVAAGSAAVEGPRDPAGRTMTAAQTRGVIPPVAVLPGGWRVDRDRGFPSPTDARAEIDPPRCQTLFDELHRAHKASGSAVAASAEGFFRARDTGPFLSVTVDSYARPVTVGVFDKAATALADCPRFTGTVDGIAAEFRASPLELPRVGDESLALRFIGETGSRPFTLDFIAVRIGNNSITAQQVSRGATADPAPLRRMVSAALQRLPAR